MLGEFGNVIELNFMYNVLQLSLQSRAKNHCHKLGIFQVEWKDWHLNVWIVSICTPTSNNGTEMLRRKILSCSQIYRRRKQRCILQRWIGFTCSQAEPYRTRNNNWKSPSNLNSFHVMCHWPWQKETRMRSSNCKTKESLTVIVSLGFPFGPS